MPYNQVFKIVDGTPQINVELLVSVSYTPQQSTEVRGDHENRTELSVLFQTAFRLFSLGFLHFVVNSWNRTLSSNNVLFYKLTDIIAVICRTQKRAL